MKEVKRIKVDKEEFGKLESLHYEVVAREQIISHMIEARLSESEGFKQYHGEFNKINKEYEALKEKISAEYLIDELKKQEFIWQADFEDDEIVVYEV